MLSPGGVQAVTTPLASFVTAPAFHQIGESSLSALNDAGTALFVAQLQSPFGSFGIFSSTGASVVLEGQEVPGAPGTFFQSAGAPVINNNGEVVFLAGTTGISGAGIFTLTGGLLVRTGDIAPGTGGKHFSAFGLPALNDRGEIAFWARLAEGGQGIFTLTDGTTVLTGDPAPSLGGAAFEGLGFPSLNDSGNIAFAASLSDGRQGVFTTGGGLVAVTGELVPGLGDFRFMTIGQGFVVSVNDGGQVAFAAGIGHECSFCVNTFGIFMATPETEIAVSVDIKPVEFPNSINPKSKGVIPIAILTTDTFDAITVDALSVKFGPNGTTEAHRQGHPEDVDGDGDSDLVLHFKTQATGIQCGDTSASLTGKTTGGQDIEGSDSIQTVGCKQAYARLFMAPLASCSLCNHNRLISGWPRSK